MSRRIVQPSKYASRDPQTQDPSAAMHGRAGLSLWMLAFQGDMVTGFGFDVRRQMLSMKTDNRRLSYERHLWSWPRFGD